MKQGAGEGPGYSVCMQGPPWAKLSGCTAHLYWGQVIPEALLGLRRLPSTEGQAGALSPPPGHVQPGLPQDPLLLNRAQAASKQLPHPTTGTTALWLCNLGTRRTEALSACLRRLLLPWAGLHPRALVLQGTEPRPEPPSLPAPAQGVRGGGPHPSACISARSTSVGRRPSLGA